MADTYNVIRGDGVFFEGMTKEQIISAIAEATGNTVEDIDSAFITKIKEINKGNAIKLWLGTNAEYNAIATKEDDVLYFITDDTFVSDTSENLANLDEKINSNYNNVGLLLSSMSNEIDTFEENINSQIEDIMDMLGLPVRNYNFKFNQNNAGSYSTTFNINDDDFQIGVSTVVNISVIINGHNDSSGIGGNPDYVLENVASKIVLNGSFNVVSIETVAINKGTVSGNTTGSGTNKTISFTPSYINQSISGNISMESANLVLTMRVVRLS